MRLRAWGEAVRAILITRRSRVRIPPPLYRSPGHEDSRKPCRGPEIESYAWGFGLCGLKRRRAGRAPILAWSEGSDSVGEMAYEVADQPLGPAPILARLDQSYPRLGITLIVPGPHQKAGPGPPDPVPTRVWC